MAAALPRWHGGVMYGAWPAKTWRQRIGGITSGMTAWRKQWHRVAYQHGGMA